MYVYCTKKNNKFTGPCQNSFRTSFVASSKICISELAALELDHNLPLFRGSSVSAANKFIQYVCTVLPFRWRID